MRILVIGFLVFSAWAAFSTYFYVCKIKGLCDEPYTLQMAESNLQVVKVADTIRKPVIQEQIVVGKTLTIYFEFDKSDFNGNVIANKYYDESNAYLLQNTHSGIIISGYTDSIGTKEYNQALGFRRAQRMKQYFESKGIQTHEILIESKGENDPADDNGTTKGRAKNRRAVITLKK
jgi:outer membrane protein OmpA-like peptidoglycan-associated protein